jgi:5-methylcytosine-specific restriction endonuclease McrA
MNSSNSPLLERIRAACAPMQLDPNRAIEEKARELELRHFLTCVPNILIKDSQVRSYLRLVLRREPDEELVDRVVRKRRQASISESDQIALLRKQHSRCTTCGTYLDKDAQPQVDHIIPVALGGESDMSNYQLLCMPCNQGKRTAIDWVMGAPFLNTRDDKETTSLRYCVLAHAEGKCSIQDCMATTADSVLEVRLRVPWGKGGRWIFDNVIAMCEAHAAQRDSNTLQEARTASNRTRRNLRI